MCEERAGKFFPARLLYFFMIFHFAAVVLQQIFHAAAERFRESEKRDSGSLVYVFGTDFVLL